MKKDFTNMLFPPAVVASIAVVVLAANIADGSDAEKEAPGIETLPPIYIAEPGGMAVCGPYTGSVRLERGKIIVRLNDKSNARRIGAGATDICGNGKMAER